MTPQNGMAPHGCKPHHFAHFAISPLLQIHPLKYAARCINEQTCVQGVEWPGPGPSPAKAQSTGPRPETATAAVKPPSVAAARLHDSTAAHQVQCCSPPSSSTNCSSRGRLPPPSRLRHHFLQLTSAVLSRPTIAANAQLSLQRSGGKKGKMHTAVASSSFGPRNASAPLVARTYVHGHAYDGAGTCRAFSLSHRRPGSSFATSPTTDGQGHTHSLLSLLYARKLTITLLVT